MAPDQGTWKYRPAHLRHGRTDTRLRVAIPVTWPLAEVRG
jgi:hypothetical protein